MSVATSSISWRSTRVLVGPPPRAGAPLDPGPPPYLVVVEVRWRGRRDFGLAEETFDHRKRGHLRAAVGRLLEDGLPDGRPLPRLPIRVDLVAVEPATAGSAVRLRHHRDALTG
jgi:Holliday junction resolvase-like predicted endonuclease